MTCKQYTLWNKDNQNIAREDFEYYLKINFPEHHAHGMIELPDDATLRRIYDVKETVNNNGTPETKYQGKIVLQYKPKETVLTVNSRDVDGLVATMMSKNTVVINWTEKKEDFKHM